MIYKVAGFSLLAAPFVEGAWRKHTTSTLGTDTRNNIDAYRIRGASEVVFTSDTPAAVNVAHIASSDGTVGFEAEFAAISAPFVAGMTYTVYGSDVAYGGDHVTGNMLFTNAGTGAVYNYGTVQYYRGDFNSWSVQQVLRPPAEFEEQSFFGQLLDLDRDHLRTLAVGCKGCNSSFTESGSILVYEATSPSAKKWTQTALLSLRDGEGLWGLSNYQISTHKDIIVADARTLEDDTTFANFNVHSVIFQKDKDGDWSQQQALSLGPIPLTDKVTRAEVYDETIVVSGNAREPMRTATGTYGTGAVHVFYPNTKRFSGPKWKPAPVQWSVQQILVTPSAAAVSTDPANPTDLAFGQNVAIDGDRMFISEGSPSGPAADIKAGYIYERESLSGKWSLQQALVMTDDVYEAVLDGSSLVATYGTGIDYFDETGNWDCLIISLEDHFNDGWGGAYLEVDLPGSEEDRFTTRCDSSNPFQFRYCPSNVDDDGLYKFSIPDGKKAKFHWEQLWRVYEEATGTWYTGNWDTKMDFEWSEENRQFIHKKIEHELPNNITCKECPTRPTSKPSSRLRKLHSKDHTIAPTLSPAPTMSQTNYEYPWQELKLITNGGADWFDAQHRGTSYYIADKHGGRLLSVGTMCPWETVPSTKTCWEDYPDGEYILRVGGALDRDQTHTFQFCHADNPIDARTQVIFRVTNGECQIVSNIQSSFFCLHNQNLVQVSNIEFSILGVSGALGSLEYSQISSAIAAVLHGVSASNVKIMSASSNGAGITVLAQISAKATAIGVDYSDAESLDNYETRMMNALGQGHALLNALVSAEVNSNIHTATSVELHSLTLAGNGRINELQMDGPDMTTDFADTLFKETPTESTSDHHQAESVIKTVSISGYVIAAMGVMLVSFFVARRMNFNKHSTAVPTEEPSAELEASVESAMGGDDVEDIEAVDGTEDEVSIVGISKKRVVKGGSSLTLDDLKELVRHEEAALETMLQNGPQL